MQVLAIFAVLLAAYLLFKAQGIGWAQLGSPPEMEPDEADPEEQEAGVAVPTDPYTALKQNYDGVATFLMTVRPEHVDCGLCSDLSQQVVLAHTRDLMAFALQWLLVCFGWNKVCVCLIHSFCQPQRTCSAVLFRPLFVQMLWTRR